MKFCRHLVFFFTCHFLYFPAPCIQLSDPDSGSFFLDTNGTVTSATFNCVAGYEVFGPTIISCNADGLWDSQEPSCGKSYN